MSRYLAVLLILIFGVGLAADRSNSVGEIGSTDYSGQVPVGRPASGKGLPLHTLEGKLQIAQLALDREAMLPTKQDVWGTIALKFVAPALRQANLPRPPLVMTLVVRQVPGPGEFRFRITDPHPQWTEEDGASSGGFVEVAQDFTLSLMPGNYEISLVEVIASSLDTSLVVLPTESPRFWVPEDRCVYVGYIGTRYVRLPPLSPKQDIALSMEVSRNLRRDLVMVRLDTGTLLLADSAVFLPTGQQPLQGLGAGRGAYDEAQVRKCMVAPAQFALPMR